MINEEFKKALEKVDLMLRPNAIICNPQHADIIEKEFGKRYKVIVCAAVEPDKVYLVDRKSIHL